jgi:threonine dehydrogenase-like Zn-dependent dehydrogenase
MNFPNPFVTTRKPQDLFTGIPTGAALTGTPAVKKCPTYPAATDPDKTMNAIAWYGAKDVRLISRPKVKVTDPGDVLVRITTTAICGSDLHFYNGDVPEMHPGDVIGHESMGIVEDVGSEVRKFKQGDRVVVSAVIACGSCFYCQRQLFSCCESTNYSEKMVQLYGHKLAGIFGYSHLLGGYEGGQAEFIRVPYADMTLLKVPDNLPDEKVLFLSDICCTGWHANVLGGVTEGAYVAIWGAGPVGLMAAMWAKFRGASKIILIDHTDYRLDFAKKYLHGIETINFENQNVYDELMGFTNGLGPDIGIECAGFRYAKTLVHKFQQQVKLETDTPEIINEIIKCVRKGGSIAIIGDYFAKANNFMIGALMEKSLTIRGGQVCVQAYWHELLSYIEQGFVDPSFVITHKLPLDSAPDAYKMFNNQEDNCIKIVLKPSPATGGL